MLHFKLIRGSDLTGPLPSGATDSSELLPGAILFDPTPGFVGDPIGTQADGKVVRLGSFGLIPDIGLARHTPEGKLDLFFLANFDALKQGNNFVAERLSGAGLVLPDGKIVVSGTVFVVDSTVQRAHVTQQLVLLRFDSDGGVDCTFGTNGLVADPSGSISGLAAGQSDDKLLVFSADGSKLLRLDAAGQPDPTFGPGGDKITDAFPAPPLVAAIQPDGKFLLATSVDTNVPTSPIGHGSDVVLKRYGSDGSPDVTFGSGGQVVTTFGPLFGAPSGVAVQPDDRIVVAGSVGTGGTVNDGRIALARYEANGALDATFGSGGKVSTRLSNNPIPGTGSTGLILQPDGKLVVVGNLSRDGTSGETALALVRYNGDGTFDVGLGNGGVTITPVGSGHGEGAPYKLLSDGRLLVWVYRDGHVGLARYNADGTLDVTFGRGNVLQFESTVAAVREPADGVTLQILRPAGGTATATVRYATQDGTAVAAAGTLTFGPGRPARPLPCACSTLPIRVPRRRWRSR
jgi:uncharacterized delta-60 repeat protein